MKHDVQDFQKEVIERSHKIPVLVDFWAEWCGPCRVLGPVLEKLTEENKDRWVLAKVNTEERQDLAVKYNIRSIPNVKLFADGKVAAEFAGALPEYTVRQWLEKQIPSKYTKLLQMAEQLLNDHGTEKAREILNEIVEQEPANHKARVLLAQTYLLTDQEKAVELVSEIEEDSEHFQLADAVRTFASLMLKKSKPETLPEAPVKHAYLSAIKALELRDYEEALKKFIEVIRADRYYDDDGSRKACIAIFKILGEENELTQTYRREFSSALYV